MMGAGQAHLFGDNILRKLFTASFYRFLDVWEIWGDFWWNIRRFSQLPLENVYPLPSYEQFFNMTTNFGHTTMLFGNTIYEIRLFDVYFPISCTTMITRMVSGTGTGISVWASLVNSSALLIFGFSQFLLRELGFYTCWKNFEQFYLFAQISR